MDIKVKQVYRTKRSTTYCIKYLLSPTFDCFLLIFSIVILAALNYEIANPTFQNYI